MSGVLLNDEFSDDRGRGRVVGSAASDGTTRLGVDAEGCISIDGGAARFRPMVHPGYGRCGLSYGPYERRAGRTLAVFMLNGHNLSQSYELQSVWRRAARWLVGSGVDPVPRRVLRYMFSARPREGFVRKLRRWHASRKRSQRPEMIIENLFVGFLASGTDSHAPGHAFQVHSTKDYDNGELFVRAAPGLVSAFKSFQNVQVQYFVVLRERGAIYYAAGLPGAHGLGGYPMMRPIAVDPGSDDEAAELFAGVEQPVLGEIGFTNDTRIYTVRVADVPELERWFTTAHAADRLVGGGALSEAEVGGAWRVEGDIERGEHGATGTGRAMLSLTEPTGLLHAVVVLPDADSDAELIWRGSSDRSWSLGLSRTRAVLTWATGSYEQSIQAGAESSVQVLDDGCCVTVHVDGVMIGGRVESVELAGATGVGFAVRRGAAVRSFEAHPRRTPIPDAVRLGEPWDESAENMVVRDDFSGGDPEQPIDLDGRETTEGGKVWRKLHGSGVFELCGNELRVRATRERPSPGRTIYGFDWDDPGFAELEIEMTPPGSERGQGERGRGGFVFEQDDRNALLVNLWLDDHLETASISTFFRVRGWEDIYDAVWTCMGATRVTWGESFRMRAVFDGLRYRVHVNNEPVLHRALGDVYPGIEPLRITRVGLMANWEWGEDTGTVFRDFVARGR